MSIRFIRAGLQTSLQDCGRFGYMHQGISWSGAMDPLAMQMANALVSQPINSPVIEITLVGPKIQFNCDLTIAICGAYFDILLNDKKVFNNRTISVKPGDVLDFVRLKSGARAYMAFSGKVKLDKTLSSYSTHLTANFGGHSLKNGDQFIIKSISDPKNKIIPEKFLRFYSGNYLLRCVPSVETTLFNQQQREFFFSNKFKIMPDSNRMGIRLKGQPLLFGKPIQINSSGLSQGSIQIPPSGQPIISSVDGQTIGGYPRIATIITADLPLLGQLKAQDSVSFALIDLPQALKILKKNRSILEQLFKAL